MQMRERDSLNKCRGRMWRMEKQIEIMESAYDDGVKLLESMSFE